MKAEKTWKKRGKDYLYCLYLYLVNPRLEYALVCALRFVCSQLTSNGPQPVMASNLKAMASNLHLLGNQAV